MKNFFGFLAATAGRIVRGIAGIALIALGLAVVGGTTGTVNCYYWRGALAAGLF